jgi:hypothetical protein
VRTIAATVRTIAFALLLAAACASPAPTGATMMTTTTIEGTAHNVKGGAVVIDAAGKPTRISGLDEWPADLADHAVVVTGRLETHTGPACVNDPEPCQGISGTYVVLVDARWRAR